MSFVSPEFALLCLLFLPLYWMLARWLWTQKWALVLAGYGLYMSWTPAFALVLLAFSTSVWAIAWVSARGGALARAWVSGIWLAACFLLVVKYYDFLRSSLLALDWLWLNTVPAASWLTPVAVSFFIFQAITYLVAVGRGELAARSWSDVLLFLCFWPTLFAGPIWRATDFFAQRDAGRSTCGQPLEAARALYLILLGLVQKVVLASWLATGVVDPVFALPGQFGSGSVLAGMVAYSLQIFLDFAGYTSIVTGLALLLGYRLPLNFRQPYLARNVQAFWTRWHVSLSGFIRDYIYIPLGGSRSGWGRTQFNVLVGMAISGLWHGAQWSFVFWGLLHGLGVVVFNTGRRLGLQPLPQWLAWALTFSFITVAWVFFRADSLAQALDVLAALWPHPGQHAQVPGLGVLALLLGLLCLSQHAQRLENACVQQLQEMGLLQWLCVLVLVMSLIIVCGPEGVPGFIYYRF